MKLSQLLKELNLLRNQDPIILIDGDYELLPVTSIETMYVWPKDDPVIDGTYTNVVEEGLTASRSGGAQFAVVISFERALGNE